MSELTKREMNTETTLNETKPAEGRSRFNAGSKEIERICACVQKSGHYAVVERNEICGYYVLTNYGTIQDQTELEEWMREASFTFPHVACV